MCYAAAHPLHSGLGPLQPIIPTASTAHHVSRLPFSFLCSSLSIKRRRGRADASPCSPAAVAASTRSTLACACPPRRSAVETCPKRRQPRLAAGESGPDEGRSSHETRSKPPLLRPFPLDNTHLPFNVRRHGFQGEAVVAQEGPDRSLHGAGAGGVVLAAACDAVIVVDPARVSPHRTPAESRHSEGAIANAYGVQLSRLSAGLSEYQYDSQLVHAQHRRRDPARAGVLAVCRALVQLWQLAFSIRSGLHVRPLNVSRIRSAFRLTSVY